jgi:riboflavin synthase
MFTGIVQGKGRIASVGDRGDVRTFEIEMSERLVDGLEVGGSVAVDGVCLTATSILSGRGATFDVMLPSLASTTLGDFEPDRLVNIERAARDGAEIGGHPLSGHVDFSTTIWTVSSEDGNTSVRISIPRPFERYIFAKGYVAVNGCSLTVSDCNKAQGWFEVWLIPETCRATNMGSARAGDRLNVEIERGTQVVVDTVRDAMAEMLGELRPALESFLGERGPALEPVVAQNLIRASRRRTLRPGFLRSR